MEDELSTQNVLNHTDAGGRGAFETFSFAMNVVVAGSVSVAGSICNVLCFLTIQQDRHKLSMSILLQGLAVSDTLFLLYTFLYTVLRSVYPGTGYMKAYYDLSPYIVAYVLPFGWIAQTTSTWIIVLVTIDRYVAVCHPFQAKNWCNIHRARTAVVVVWLASVVFNFPRFFYYHHRQFGVDNGNQTTISGTFVAHAESESGGEFWERYRTIYHIGISMAMMYVIPVPVLACLNTKLIREIANARKRQLQLTGTKNERDTLAVTINLIAVVTVFIICETPDFIATIITLEHIHVSKVTLQYFLCIKEFLLVFSRAINFVIYCLFYSKFRRLLRILLCRRCLYAYGETFMSTTNDTGKYAVSQGEGSSEEQELKRILIEEKRRRSREASVDIR